MTDSDIAQLRGQNFGLQFVLAICLAKLSEAMPEGNQFLHTIQNMLIPSIDKAPVDFLEPSLRQTFVASAIAAVGQIAEGARGLRADSVPPKLDA